MVDMSILQILSLRESLSPSTSGISKLFLQWPYIVNILGFTSQEAKLKLLHVYLYNHLNVAIKIYKNHS